MMLKADVHYQGEHARIDFHGSQEEIGGTHIKLVDTPLDRLTAKNVEFPASSGRLYTKLQKVINEKDTLKDTFLAYKKL